MVIAYHLIATAYGRWLPNDPRGSMSRVICSDVIAELGALHFGRKKVQPASCDIRAFHASTRDVLKHEPLEFSAADRVAIADAFSQVIQQIGYVCYACAIMWDHVHLCIRKHRHQAENMIAHLQEGSRRLLIERGLRAPEQPVWGGPGWKVYLDSPDDIYRTADYIRQNYTKARWPIPTLGFITPYDGWQPARVRVASPIAPRSR